MINRKLGHLLVRGNAILYSKLVVSRFLTMLLIFVPTAFSGQANSVITEFLKIRGFSKIDNENPLSKTGSRIDLPGTSSTWSLPFFSQGPAGAVVSTHTFGDSIVLTGYFGGADNVVSNGVVLWDGEKWIAMNSPNPTTMGHVICVMMDGARVYVGGGFESSYGFDSRNVAYWDNTGWHAMVMPFDNAVTAISSWNGQVVVATERSVYEWSGSSWKAVGEKYSGVVTKLVGHEGKLWLAGKFRMDADSSIENLVVLENGKWNTVGNGQIGRIRDLAWVGSELFALETKDRAVPNDTQIIHKWNGSIWSNVKSDIIPGFIQALEFEGKDLYLLAAEKRLVPDGNIPIEVLAPGSRVFGLQVLKYGGSTFQPFLSEKFTGILGDLAFSKKGLVVAGRFSGIGNARLDNAGLWDGNKWLGLTSGVSAGPNYISEVMVSDGSNFLIGGAHLSYGGAIPGSGVFSLNGATWSSPSGGVTGTANIKDRNGGTINRVASVKVIKPISGGYYVGGIFDSAGGLPARNIAKWDGIRWQPMGDGYQGTVFDIVEVGQTVYAAGYPSMPGWDTTAPLWDQSVTQWNGNKWEKVGGGIAVGPIIKLAWFKNMLVGAPARPFSDSLLEIIGWTGDAWGSAYFREPFRKGKRSPIIMDMVAHKDEIYLLTEDRLIKWDGYKFSVVIDSLSDCHRIVEDGSSVYFIGARFGQARAATGVYEWDGVRLNRLTSDRFFSSGFSSYPVSMGIHGDYLYVSGVLGAMDNGNSWFYARWNRKAGAGIRDVVKGERRAEFKKWTLVRSSSLMGIVGGGGGIFDISGKKVVEMPAKAFDLP